MEAIRISVCRSGEIISRRTLSLRDEDDELATLRTHLLANKAEVDRVLFQLPKIEPHHQLFKRYLIPSVIQMAPGVSIVRQIAAARLFNERGAVTSIDDPERYTYPTFSAHLTNWNGALHPLALGNFIRDVVELAYSPDTIISVLHATPDVEQLGQPRQVLTLRTNYKN